MARLVVTLPPDLEDAVAFARAARAGGASLLELRSDLHDEGLDVGALAGELELLVAERGRALPDAWRGRAAIVDREAVTGASLVSLHATSPLTPAEAEAVWADRVIDGVLIKHVEPLGDPHTGARLLETQARLLRRYGPRVTVLATGPLALPFRAILAERNALDYVAADATWAAARGQRLLVDAARGGSGARLGLVGSGLAASPLPLSLPPPFDRIELAPDAEVGALLEALLPFHRGLLVEAPFQRQVARHLSSSEPSVDTLVRQDGRWRGTWIGDDAARLRRLR